MEDEFFIGALEAVGSLLKGHEGGVADEDGGVGVVEHVVEVGAHGQELGVGVLPLVKEDAGVGDGGAAGCVCGDGANLAEWLAGAADEQQRADAGFGGDGAAGEHAQAGCGGERGDGDEADVGLAGGEAVGALGGEQVVDLVALGERAGEGWVLEVPHEGRGIEEADGGDAQLGRRDTH